MIRLQQPIFRPGFVLVGVKKNKGPDQAQFPFEGIYLTEAELKLHTGIFGASGMGKTFLLRLIAVQCIWNGWPLVILDQKYDDDLFKAVWAAAYLCGRKDDVQLVSPYALENPSGDAGRMGTCSYNPLMSFTLAQSLSDALLVTGKKDGDSNAFWEGVKNAIVLNFISAFVSAQTPFVFKDFWIALDDPRALQMLHQAAEDETAKYKIQKWLDRLGPGADPRERKEQSDEFKGTIQYFTEMSSGPLGKLLDTYEPDVTLRKALVEKKIVYFVLQSQMFANSSAQLAKLIISESNYLAGTLQMEGKSKCPFVFIIDEAYKITNKELETAFAMNRSAGLCYITVYQSLAQMSEAVNNNFKDILLSNMSNKIMFRPPENAQAKYLAELIGHHKMKTSTSSAKIPMMGGETESLAETFLVTPTEIQKLEKFQAIYQIGSHYHKGWVPNFFTDWQL